MIEIHLIIFFMIVAAVIAIEVKDLLSGVIAVGAVGIGLCMAFLLLKAPDLAITQLVVEILSLIILIRATIHKDLPFSTSGRWVFNTTAILIFIAVFLISAYISLKGLPDFGQPLLNVSRFYLVNAFPMTGEHNIVSAIALKFRPMDTLGEATAIFAAVIGVLAIARRISRQKSRD